MSEDVSTNSGSFDLDRLKALIELMEKHGLTEISLRRGDQKWRLRRGPQEMIPTNASAAATSPNSAAPVPVSEPGTETNTAAVSEAIAEVKSPTIGTFYAASSPEDPPFVSIGSKVQPDTIVCIVEAMKVFNQIPAEVNGTVIEVLINNGDSVEFGQALFRVRLG